MAAYIALLRKDTGSDFGVEFPDFPGCVTAGSTLEEARIMAAEALALHIEGMIEDGVAIPASAELDAIAADANNSAVLPFLVEVPIQRSRVMRVNVTLPEDLVQEIDRVSKNRSRFLADAARDHLRHPT
jgi:predicted RNase H-like HicB family nuclease